MQNQPNGSPRNGRRSYGTGRVYVRTDANGRETFYGSWYANGRRVNRSLGLKRGAGKSEGLTQAQAEAALRTLMATVTPTAAPTGGRLTVEEVSARYVAHIERRGRKLSTRSNVESETRVHLAPFFRGRTLDAISHQDVVDLLGTLESKGLAPKSIRNAIGTLSALFNFAKAPQRRWATTNPCEGLELPSAPQTTEIRFLTLEEVRGMVANVPPGMYEQLDRVMFLAAAMTGLRKGELVALRWRDVDWTALRVRVRQNYTRGEFGTPKSRRSTRSVPLADELAGELDRLYKTSRWTGDGDLVFAHPVTGGVQPKANITRRFRASLRAAGLDDRHVFHDLRHTFGTRMAAAGVPMRTVQEWMGHRDVQTTLIYADYSPSAHEAEMVAAAFADPIELEGSNQGSILSESEDTSENLIVGISRGNDLA
jgi:integrase